MIQMSFSWTYAWRCAIRNKPIFWSRTRDTHKSFWLYDLPWNISSSKFPAENIRAAAKTLFGGGGVSFQLDQYEFDLKRNPLGRTHIHTDAYTPNLRPGYSSKYQANIYSSYSLVDDKMRALILPRLLSVSPISLSPPKVDIHISVENLFLYTSMHRHAGRHIPELCFSKICRKKEISSLIFRIKSNWETSGASLRGKSTPTEANTYPTANYFQLIWYMIWYYFQPMIMFCAQGMFNLLWKITLYFFLFIFYFLSAQIILLHAYRCGACE